MMIASLAGSAASIILAENPSLTKTTQIRIRGRRIERFRFLRLRCGKNCRWDYSSPWTTKIEKYDDDWYEDVIGLVIPADKEFIKEREFALIKKHRIDLSTFWRKSKYCKPEGFICEKGKMVPGTTQLCENFKWKTRD